MYEAQKEDPQFMETSLHSFGLCAPTSSCALDLGSAGISLERGNMQEVENQDTLQLVEWGRQLMGGRIFATFGIHPNDFDAYSKEVPASAVLF